MFNTAFGQWSCKGCKQKINFNALDGIVLFTELQTKKQKGPSKQFMYAACLEK